MGINLIKGQKISLAKKSGEKLTHVMAGLGWDPAPGVGGSIDLDASCIMYDANKNLVDAVFFGGKTSKDGSLQHQGDNLTGAGDGDDEQILMDLTRVSSNIASIFVVITSYSGQTFNQIANAFCRLVDQTTNQEIARYQLTGSGDYTAQIMVKIYRHNGEWKVQAVGEPAMGKTFRDLVDIAARL